MVVVVGVIGGVCIVVCVVVSMVLLSVGGGGVGVDCFSRWVSLCFLGVSGVWLFMCLFLCVVCLLYSVVVI